MEGQKLLRYAFCWQRLRRFISDLLLAFPDDEDFKDLDNLLQKIEREFFE